MASCERRTALRVRHGRVSPKNRWIETKSYWNTPQPELVIDVQRPGYGHRHVVSKRDVEAFVELVPGWQELAVGVRAIVLAAGGDLDGWCSARGVLAVCAYPRDLDCELSLDYVKKHAALFECFGVPVKYTGADAVVSYTRGTARAFLLLHVLLHELGHHVDRMTTRSRRKSCRGEPFAEAFAFELGEKTLDAYLKTFDLD